MKLKTAKRQSCSQLNLPYLFLVALLPMMHCASPKSSMQSEQISNFNKNE